MAILITGFGAISVTAFVWPNSEVSPEDRKCRIGQLLKVTVPLLTYDIIINVSLTTLFVHLLHPFLAPKGNRVSLGHSLSSPNQDRVIGRLRRLVMKTIIGAILIMVPTLANLSGMLITKGREQGWMCLTLCTLDGKSRCAPPQVV